MDGHGGAGPRGCDRDAEARQRVPDHDDRAGLLRDGVEDLVHVALGSRIGIVAGQVDGCAGMSARLQLSAELVPAPGPVLPTVPPPKLHSRTISPTYPNHHP